MAVTDEKVVDISKHSDETQEKGEKGEGKELDVQATYELGGVIKNGIKVHPQPTADPLDPLTWSSFKKHTILGIVMFK